MKSLFVLAGLFVLQSARGQVNDHLQLSNNYPAAGETLTITYNPVGTVLEGKPVQAKVYYWEVKGFEAQDLELKPDGGKWNGTIHISAGATVMVFNFNKDNIVDNNGDKGYVSLIYKGNKPVPEAFASEAVIYVGAGNYYAKIKPNLDEAIALYEKEFALYPDSEKKYKSTYYQFLISAKKPGAKEQAEKDAALLMKSSDEKDLILANSYLKMVNKKTKSDSLIAVIKNKYPAGELVKQEMIMACFTEKDLDKKQHIYNDLLLKYPEKTTDNIYDELRKRIALSYLQEGKFNEYQKQIALVKDKSGLAMSLNNIAYGWAQKDVYIDIAAIISKQSLDTIDNHIKNPVQTKPARYTLSDWTKMENGTYNMFADTYAFILYKQGKYDEALKYIQPVYEHSKKPGHEVEGHYALILGVTGNPQKAMDIIEPLIKNGQSSKELDNALKKDYVKVKGSDAGFEAYLAALQVQAKDKSHKNIVKQMINEPAPAFAIKDINGNKVSLLDLKGKVVVLDFWATWCGPCKASLPGMQMAVNKYKDNPNVKFLFIDTWENGDDFIDGVKKFIADNKYTINVLIDEKGSDGRQSKVVSAYKVSGIPTKFVIDKNGNIRFKHVGYQGSADALVEEISTMIDIAANPEPANASKQQSSVIVN